MNKYEIQVLSYGIVYALIIPAPDAGQAIYNCGYPANEIISLKLIGSTAEPQDLT